MMMKRRGPEVQGPGHGWGQGRCVGALPWRTAATHLQVNRTFEQLSLLKDLHEVWGVLGPQIFSFMNDSSNVALLQVGQNGSGHFQAMICRSEWVGGDLLLFLLTFSFARDCWKWRTRGRASRHPEARCG